MKSTRISTGVYRTDSNPSFIVQKVENGTGWFATTPDTDMMIIAVDKKTLITNIKEFLSANSPAPTQIGTRTANGTVLCDDDKGKSVIYAIRNEEITKKYGKIVDFDDEFVYIVIGSSSKRIKCYYNDIDMDPFSDGDFSSLDTNNDVDNHKSRMKKRIDMMFGDNKSKRKNNAKSKRTTKK